MDKKNVYTVQPSSAMNYLQHVKSLRRARAIVCDTSGFHRQFINVLRNAVERGVAIFTTRGVVNELYGLRHSALKLKHALGSEGINFVNNYQVRVLHGADPVEQFLLPRLATLVSDALFMGWVREHIEDVYWSISCVVNDYFMKEQNMPLSYFTRMNYPLVYRALFVNELPAGVAVIRSFAKDVLEDTVRESPVRFSAAVNGFGASYPGFFIMPKAFDMGSFDSSKYRFAARLAQCSARQDSLDTVIDHMMNRWQISDTDMGVVALAYDRNIIPKEFEPVAVLSADGSIESLIKIRTALRVDNSVSSTFSLAGSRALSSLSSQARE